MAFKIESINVDLLQNRAKVVISDREEGTDVYLSVNIANPDNEPEDRLKGLAMAAARDALIGALTAL